MRKVFLDDLPRCKTALNNGNISWVQSIGKDVNFVYDDIAGIIKLIDYNKTKSRLIVEYDGKVFENIFTGDFTSGKLGKIAGKITKDFKLDIGNVLNDNGRDLIIIKREYRIKERISKITKSGKSTVHFKYYKYHCNLCDYEQWIEESPLLNLKQGCAYCCGRATRKGYNDLATTNPELIKYLVNKDDAYVYTAQSSKLIKVKCPECGGYEHRMSVSNLYKNKFSCKKCGDGISYPEKFMFNVLEQSKIKFQTQLSKKQFLWAGNYYYDFYIPSLNCIIETHGEQHYRDTGFTMNYIEQSERDRQKKDNAIKNGIDHYIVINCSMSDIDFIKNSIKESKLSKLICLGKIDWELVHSNSLKNLVKAACELKNKNQNYTTGDIGEILNLCSGTILRYIKLGSKLGWCNYNKNDENILSSKKRSLASIKSRSKSVEVCCLTQKQQFSSLSELERDSMSIYGIKIFAATVRKSINTNIPYQNFTFTYTN